RRATDIALYDGLNAASQNACPRLGVDLGALVGGFAPLFPAGFYYKTFMQPRALWRHLWEPLLRRMAGLGRAPALPDPSRYDKCHIHCDVLVVGAGPAGLAAALAAGRSGARVILADSEPLFGGALLRRSYRVGDGEGTAWAAAAIPELQAMPEVRLLPGTTVLGHYDDNYLIAAERVGEGLGPAAPPGLPRQRLWHIRARRVVLATGALERSLVFAGNDRPGVMLASAVETYVNRYAVAPGPRAVLFADNDDAYHAAAALDRAGVPVAPIIDPPARPGNAALSLIDRIPLFPGHAVVATAGRAALRRVYIRPLAGIGRRRIAIDCDLLAVSGGWNPTLHLFAQAQGRLRFDEGLAAFVPEADGAAVECVGAARGSFSLARCLSEGAAAGARAAALCGFGPVGSGGEAPLLPLVVVEEEAAAGAVFEDIGQWQRARYYPQPGEDMRSAVRRECLAVRDRVALLDASTLGKIEVTGPDAGHFLDRIYINRWQNLTVARCRYGVM